MVSHAAPSPSRDGFTLVELSIVLVIIGLLTGGVLTGQSLIHAAELRAVTTQHDRYIAAVQTFRDKYFAIPGDMTNATAYWGTAAAGTACPTTIGTGTQTCNGDGDGTINHSLATSNESFRFWQHLANAGLIEGNYDGTTHGSTNYSATVANSPAGRITSTMWFAFTFGAQSGSAQMFDGQYDNTLEFGAIIANGDPAGPALKPEDAYNVDTKLDDGKPATGSLVIRTVASLNTCTDSNVSTALGANYLLTSTSPACALIFRRAF